MFKLLHFFYRVFLCLATCDQKFLIVSGKRRDVPKGRSFFLKRNNLSLVPMLCFVFFKNFYTDFNKEEIELLK